MTRANTTHLLAAACLALAACDGAGGAPPMSDAGPPTGGDDAGPPPAPDAGARSEVDSGAAHDAGPGDAAVDPPPTLGPSVAVHAALVGEFDAELDRYGYRYTTLDVLPVDPPALAVYEDYSGYNDHRLGGELVPLGGAAYGFIRLTGEMVVGAVGARGVAGLRKADGPCYAPTGWEDLEAEYDRPPGAREGWLVDLSSGEDGAAFLSRERTADGTRDTVGRFEWVDGELSALEQTPLPYAAYVTDLAASPGSLGYCWAWASFRESLLVERRCGSLEAPASVEEPGVFTHWSSTDLPAWPIGASDPAVFGTWRSLFVTREGDALVRGRTEDGVVDFLWVRRNSAWPQDIVRLPDPGRIDSVARVGDLVLAVVAAEDRDRPDALMATSLAAPEGWSDDRWRAVTTAPGQPPLACEGRARLLELASGDAYLACVGAEHRVPLYRLSAAATQVP